MNHTILLHDFSSIDYKEGWDFQEKLFNRLVEDKKAERDREQHLIFCEHPHVYTLGKSGTENNLLINEEFLKKINATFYRTNRGGDITYHGPGQLVGYPIFDLDLMNLGLKQYIFQLEEVIISTLQVFGIVGTRMDGATGVWLDVNVPAKARKICAIGVRSSHWVTMHGFAFNVNTNLEYFNYINPCGFVDKGVTSLQKELGKPIELQLVKDEVTKALGEIFKINFSISNNQLV